MMNNLELDKVYKEKGNTWPKILKYNYEKYGNKHKAMRSKRLGIWQPYTWKDYYNNVKYLALGLLSLGFESGNKLLIIGSNVPHWYFAYLATQANHGISVGLYSELSPADIKYVAENAEARFAIVEGQELVDNLLEIKNELPLLEKVIYWDYKGLDHYRDHILIDFEQVLELGAKYEEENPETFEKNVKLGNNNEICAIVYTSGTTGFVPKGAVHTYSSMIQGACNFLLLDQWNHKDNSIPSKSPAWIIDQLLWIGCHLLSASIINLVESPETQQNDMREIGPSIISYEVQQCESQVSTVYNKMQKAVKIKRLVFRLFMPIGYNVADFKYKKRKLKVFWSILNAFAYIVLFRPLKDSLGLSNVRIFYTYGSMISSDIFRFYHALNVPLKSIYITTETGLLTSADYNNMSLGTFNVVQKGTEIRMTDNGELICRQANMFLGYYNDSHNTAQVLKKGWFHTGDSGYVNEDGRIVLIDRISDVIELDSGDKLSSQLITCQLRFSDYIKNAMVFCSSNKLYIFAIIVINFLSIDRWVGDKGLIYSNYIELTQKPEVYQLINNEIKKVNGTLPPGFRVKKYAISPMDFSIDNRELTATGNLRRIYIKEHYIELINAMNSGKTNAINETTKSTIMIKCVEGETQ